MDKWSERTLGEICDGGKGVIRTGPFGSQLHQYDYSSEGIPVVMPKDIVGDKISSETIARVGRDHVTRLSQHILSEGDIIYGRRGDIGRQALVSKNQAGWLCGTGCIRITLGTAAITPSFLHYYLQEADVVSWIYNQAVGATMPNLNTSILQSVPVKYPPLPVQRKISAILSAYDDLIENNMRRIKILEEMAQNLYREWFVKFRFPGHQHTRFVDSPFGRIPEGWEVDKLGGILELNYGKALKQEYRHIGDVPVYGSSGVVGYHDVPLVKGPGVIVGRKGNVGSIFWSEKDFYPIDTVYFVTSKKPLRFLFYDLQTKNFINNDAAVPGLNRNQAYSLEVIVPPNNVLMLFCKFADEFEEQAVVLRAKNNSLRRTRDLLLPKLISGEVDVSDLDITVPEEGIA